MKVKILLHICCAPCLIYPLEILRDTGHDVCGDFFNPNIHPYSEYQRRLAVLDAFAGQEGLRVMSRDAYPLAEFFRRIAFREEDRCRYCYGMRLARTAALAKEGGFDAFTTTLLGSPFQKHDLIRAIGETVAGEQGIPFFYQDFRQGWSEGVRESKERGMYRQRYCGCIYSEKERLDRAPQRPLSGDRPAA